MSQSPCNYLMSRPHCFMENAYLTLTKPFLPHLVKKCNSKFLFPVPLIPNKMLSCKFKRNTCPLLKICLYMEQMEQFCFLLLYLTQVGEVTTNNTYIFLFCFFFFKNNKKSPTNKQKTPKEEKKDPTSPYLLRIRLVWHFPPTLPFQISVTHICFFLRIMV